MDKEVVVYNGVLPSYKKEQIWVSWNDLGEPIMQSGVSQKEKNKYRMLTRVYGI